MTEADEVQVTAGQRRLRHLSSILVRYITNETTEQLPPLTRAPSLPRGTSIDDLDFELRRRKAQSKRKISLSQATKDRQATPQATTPKGDAEPELRRISRPRTFSSTSVKTVASRDDPDGEGDDDSLLSPMPKLRRDRALSRASIVSQASSVNLYKEPDPSVTRCRPEPQPQCCLMLSLPAFTDGKGKAPACFFASQIVTSRNPTFEIDPESFKHADEYLLRQSRFVAEVWVSEVESDQWKLHMQWDVDLNGLATLGEDLSVSSSQFRDNSLVFALSSGEFLTAPSVSLSMLSSYDRLPESASPIPEQEDDEGTLSDPGTSEALDKARASKAIADARRKDRQSRLRAIEISKKETRMLPSIGVGGIVRLLTLQTCIDDMRTLTQQSIAKLDRLVDQTGGMHQVKRKQDATRARLQRKQAEVLNCEQAAADGAKVLESFKEPSDHVCTARETAKHRKEELAARRKKLADAEQGLRTARDTLDETLAEVSRDRASYAKLQNNLVSTRALRVSELGSIFAIKPLSGPLLFSICDTPLPNSTFDGTDDDTISSALGWTAQLVSSLSHYLSLALPYPLACRGSRSLISDHITGGIRGLRAFPLYAKGVDRYRFEYAVFLLNKDIEHLLTLHRPRPVAVLDLKQTLPNLYNLVLTATSASFDTSATDSINGGGLEPPAIITASSSSDSASDASGADESDIEERAPSIRSTASGRTLRPRTEFGLGSDEKRASSQTRAAEKLRALTSGAESIVHG